MKLIKVYGCEECWAGTWCDRCNDTPFFTRRTTWKSPDDIATAKRTVGCVFPVPYYAKQYEPPREVPDVPTETCGALSAYSEQICVLPPGHCSEHIGDAGARWSSPDAPTETCTVYPCVLPSSHPGKHADAMNRITWDEEPKLPPTPTPLEAARKAYADACVAEIEAIAAVEHAQITVTLRANAATRSVDSARAAYRKLLMEEGETE